jgi:DNA-binding XRE family transcriptional regulator
MDGKTLDLANQVKMLYELMKSEQMEVGKLVDVEEQPYKQPEKKEECIKEKIKGLLEQL